MSHLTDGDDALHDEDGRHRFPAKGMADPRRTDQLRQHLAAHWRKRRANKPGSCRWRHPDSGA